MFTDQHDGIDGIEADVAIRELRRQLEKEQQGIRHLQINLQSQNATLEGWRRLERTGTQRVNRTLFPPPGAPPASSSMPFPQVSVPSSYATSLPTTFGGATQSKPFTQSQPFTDAGLSAFQPRLRSSQGEVGELQRKLQISAEISARQSAVFRDTINDMEQKLKLAVSARDELLAIRQDEADNQQKLINHLASTLDKIEHAKKSLERDLELAKSDLERNMSENRILMKFVDNMKKVVHGLHSIERQSFAFTTEGNVKETTQVVCDTILDSIQKYFVKLMEDKEIAEYKMKKAEEELQNVKHTHQIEVRKVSEDSKLHEDEIKRMYQDMLDDKTQTIKILQENVTGAKNDSIISVEKYENELKIANNRFETLKVDFENLQTELKSKDQSIKEEHQSFHDQLKSKDKEIAKILADKNGLDLEKLELLKTVDTLSKDILRLKQELTDTKSRNKELQSKLKDEKLESDRLLSSFKENMELKAVEMKALEEKCCKDLENEKTRFSLTLKQSNEDLRRMVERQFEETVNQVKELNEKLNSNVAQLSERDEKIAEISDRNDMLTVENNDLKEKVDNLITECTELRTKIDSVNCQLEETRQNILTANEEYGKLSHKYDEICARNEEMSEIILHKDKDLSSAKSTIENLRSEIEERTREKQVMYQQLMDLSLKLEHQSDDGLSPEQERNSIKNIFMEKLSEIEELKKQREQLVKKLKKKHDREQDLGKELEASKHSIENLQKELADTKRKINEISQDLINLQTENVNLRGERDVIMASMEGKSGEQKKEIKKLLRRLHGSETDLVLTRKVLKAKRDVDSKAIRVAGEMQTEVTKQREEVDSLQNKVRWLEESLESQTKEKKYVEAKLAKLSSGFKGLVQEKERLDAAAENYGLELEKEKSECYRLKGALEKAAIKYAEVKNLLEHQEQIVARERLKHSLQIMEMERKMKGSSEHIQPILSAKSSDMEVVLKPRETDHAVVLRETPVRDTETKDKQLNQNDSLETELKDVLKEVRGLLSYTVSTIQLDPRTFKQVLNQDIAIEEDIKPERETLNHLNGSETKTSKSVKHRKRDKRTKKDKYDQVGPPLRSSSPLRLDEENEISIIRRTEGNVSKDQVTENQHSKIKDTNNIKVSQRVRYSRKEASDQLYDGRPDERVAAASDDAKRTTNTLTRLEDKLKRLENIAGKLASRNKELSSFIGHQSDKIKLCRHQEQDILKKLNASPD